MKEEKMPEDKKKVGRPKIEIDKDQFEKLCAMMCTEDEISGFFHCSVDTIERFCYRTYKVNFADIYKTLSSIGKISLRRSQLRLAETNASMAIFLGKQYLDQSDKLEDVVSFEDLKPLAEMLKYDKDTSTND